MATPSQFDQEILPKTRDHINSFIIKTAKQISNQCELILEIGPQNHSLLKEHFISSEIDTLDIVDTYKPTFVGDITKYNKSIPNSVYDCVVCMEVLEHTLNPFDAIKELRRILKHEGYLLISAPLNFRIHGPSPDCWRFTEHGWRVLLKDFDIVEIDIMETPDRELFPIKYNILAKCNKYKNTLDNEIEFRYI